MPGQDAVSTKSFARRCEQDHLQFAAVNGELRPAVTGGFPARLRPNTLAVPGVICEFRGRYGCRREQVTQSEIRKFAYRVGEGVDAHAQRLDRIDAFEHAAIDSDLMEAERRCQAGDAAADDQDGQAVLLNAESAHKAVL